MRNFLKPITERFNDILNSKTQEEVQTNSELFQLQAQLEHEQWMREHAEKQVARLRVELAGRDRMIDEANLSAQTYRNMWLRKVDDTTLKNFNDRLDKITTQYINKKEVNETLKNQDNE